MLDLGVLDDANLGSAENAAIELEALLLDKEDGVIVLVRLRGHKGGLVLIGVELFAGRVEALETVLGEGLHEDVFRHLQAIVEVDEVLSLLRLVGELLGRNVGEGAVEIVDAVHEVLGKLLDGKVAGRFDLALCAVLEVAEVGDCAEAFILCE